MRLACVFALALSTSILSVEPPDARTLPAPAVTALSKSLEAARRHPNHFWRDTPPTNADGSVNVYVEISRGDRRKWEFDMATNVRTIDRMIPETIGGYPVNYGFVPQTVSFDGDPFDALVLGPLIEGGRLVRGTAIGVMFMEDEKGMDSKIVLSPLDDKGRPAHPLTDPLRQQIAAYFAKYKQQDPEAFSRVAGWGTAGEGLSLVHLTHLFFRECQGVSGPCTTELKSRR